MGAEDGDLFGPEIVEDDGGEEGNPDQQCAPADGEAEQQGEHGQDDGDDEDRANTGGAAGERSLRALATILGEIGEIIEQKSVTVKAHAGGDGEDQPVVGPAAGGEQKAGEGIAGDGEKIGGAEELEPGSPAGRFTHSAGFCPPKTASSSTFR